MDKSKIELNPLLPVIIKEELVDHYVFTYDIVFFLSASSLLYTLFEMKLRAWFLILVESVLLSATSWFKKKKKKKNISTVSKIENIFITSQAYSFNV